MRENHAKTSPVICPSCHGPRDYLGRKPCAENKKWEIRVFRCNPCRTVRQYVVGEKYIRALD
jgi:hypothetical protein